MKLTIQAIAALLMAGTALTSCSGDDDLLDEQQVQKGTYTLSVETAKSMTTRALALNGSTINASWATTDHIYVKKGTRWANGSLQPQTDGATATLKGTLSGVTIATDDELTLYYPKRDVPTYIGQKGTLEDIAQNYDYATATATVTAVSSGGMVAANAVSFQNQQAIVKFTLLDDVDGTTPVNATNLTISDGTNTYSVNPATTTNIIYVAIPGFSNQTVSLNATSLSGVYDFERENVTFTNGQYYTVTVKMSKTKDVYTNLADWNTTTETNPVLVLNANVSTPNPYKITRADGVIDFNGYSSTVNVYVQNNVAGRTVTLRNGTVEKEVDGNSQYNDGYLGNVIMENMTVYQNAYIDGHNCSIIGGTYYGGICNYTPDNVPAGTATIYGGYFNTLSAKNPPAGRSRGPYIIYGGKFKNDPRTYGNVTIPSGYSVKANPDADANDYPWKVSKD
ncbi:MAG: hypothetical protein J5545_01795 [Bacteroidaceae bacterium]|nr:hypothetical protein [Bacteroidaceae bacterium]MBR4897232.1 hypothetical protein [Prevotella sp.]